MLSSRPAAFSKCEQVMMQPPCMASTSGRFTNSGAVHFMYRSRSWPPRKKPVSLQGHSRQSQLITTSNWLCLSLPIVLMSV